MRILNDTHIGVVRQAGTTPASQAALTEYIHEQFRSLLPAYREDHVLAINGDLFDDFQVDLREVLWTYQTLSDWLEDTHVPQLVLIAGNHDWAPRANKLSSFHMLASLLTHRYGDKVQVIDHTNGLSRVACFDKVWAIPHMPNQDLFNMEIEKAIAEPGDFLLLHANYDNNFAAEADHSLNVSPDQAQALTDAGWHLIFAHEHQARNPAPNITIVGNQFPTSISDCLNNDTKKYIGIRDNEMKHVQSWSRDFTYADTDWRHVEGLDFDGIQFLRVSGTAEAEEADTVINTVNALRKRHPAFVVSNAVRVAGLAEMDALASLSFEEVSAFDVLSALLAELTEPEAKVVTERLV